MSNRFLSSLTQNRTAKIEVFFLAAAIAYVSYVLRSMLFYGTTTWPHDGVYWGFPIFHHFAESLMNGNIPLWNPFDHGGEPFFPLLFADRCLDPTAILTVLVGQHFTTDTVVLSHWARFLQSVATLLGAYLWLRLWTKELWIRLALIPLLFFSFFLIGSFRQPSLMYVFAWLPFLVYFLTKIFFFGDNRTSNWLLVGMLIGIQWQHYLFTGTWVFLLFFAVGMIAFERRRFWEVLRKRETWGKMAAAGLIVVLMMGPNLYLYFTQGDFIFPARMIPQNWQNYAAPLRGALPFEGGPKNIVPPLRLSYAVAAFTGTVAWLWDYMQTVIPDAAYVTANEMGGNWRGYHDGQFYLGLLCWIIGTIGIFFGRTTGRRVWLLCVTAMALLMLGKGGGLHPLLYHVYPPLQMMRHTSGMIEILYFFWLYFFVEGLGVLREWWSKEQSLPSVTRSNVLLGLTCAGGLAVLLNYGIFGMNEDYAYSFIYPVIFICWLLRKRLGRVGLVLIVALAPAMFALYGIPNITYYLFHLFLFAFLPFLIFIWFLQKATPQRGQILTVLFLGVLVIEFVGHLQMSSWLYKGRAHPMKLVLVDTYRLPPEFPNRRIAFPPAFSLPGSSQSVRYLSMVYRVPTALSTPLPANPGVVIDNFEKGLRAMRWTSLMLSKNYFELLHSGAPIEALEEIFAIRKEVFQFRHGVFRLPDQEMARFLNYLGPKGARGWLERFIVVAPRKGEALGPEAPLSSKPGSFSYKVLEYAHGNFSVAVNSSEPGYLYWADGYDKNWRAFLNGKEIPIERANQNFKAIMLTAGAHTLRFSYEPFWFLVSLFIFYAAMATGILGALALQWRERVRLRREAEPGTPLALPLLPEGSLSWT